MFYSPRRVTYPLFIIIFSLVFFGILYLYYFNQGLTIHDAGLYISGGDIVIKMFIDNNSGHQINNIAVSVESSAGQTTSYYLKGKKISDSFLAAGEKYEFVASQPISNALNYTVVVSAPFNQSIRFSFPIDETTLEPVKAEVTIPSKLYLGEEYKYLVKLCNNSKSDLDEVVWLEQAAAGSFKESFFERTISLKLRECKTIYSTLTPNKLGEVPINFVLKVGSLEKKNAVIINVVQR